MCGRGTEARLESRCFAVPHLAIAPCRRRLSLQDRWERRSVGSRREAEKNPSLPDLSLSLSLDSTACHRHHPLSIRRIIVAMNASAGMDLTKRPLVRPPPGVVSNFDNPEMRGNAYKPVIIGFALLGTLVTIMRLYTRARIVRKMGADDCMCLLFVRCGLC